jgi:hypothetical protein
MAKALKPAERRRVASRNRVRSTMYLPSDVNLDEVDWQPTVGEKRAEVYHKTRLRKLEWLDEQQKRREAAELQWLRDRVAVLESVIQADKEFIKQENERERQRMAAEEQVNSVRDYYLTEKQKEEKASDAMRRARLSVLTAAMNKDIARTERKALENRGAVRGRRRS